MNLVEFTPELIPQFLPLVHFFFRLHRGCLLLLEILIAGFEFRCNIGQFQFQLLEPGGVIGEDLARIL